MLTIPLGRAAPSMLPRHSRFLSETTNLRATVDLPLLPNGPGVFAHYYVNVTIGGQIFPLIADTGSTDLAIPLTGCRLRNEAGSCPGPVLAPASFQALSCSDQSVACLNGLTAEEYCARQGESPMTPTCNNTFNELDVSYAAAPVYGHNGACGVAELYGLSSGAYHGWRGIAGTAEFQLTSVPAARVKLAGILDGDGFSSQLAPKQLPGIIGLGFSPASVLGQPSAVQQLLEANNLDQVFALCVGTGGGSMSVGGADPELYVGDVLYTPVTSVLGTNKKPEHDLFRLLVSSITIGNDSAVLAEFDVDWHSDQTFVDSGTPVTIVTNAIFNQIQSALEKVSDSCSVLTDQEGFKQLHCVPSGNPKDVPAITLHVGYPGKEIDIAVYQYVLVTAHGTWVSLIRTTAADSNQNVLGSPFMAPYYTIFDYGNARMGFAVRSQDARCGNALPADQFRPPPQPFVAPPSSGLAPWVYAVIALSVAFGVVAICVMRRRRKRRGSVNLMAMLDAPSVTFRGDDDII
eukprot:CAMPEP_0114567230 /NCGR_PEP_ID=MMETSP0114-20121206/15358_1 /TAXON_ID=31324 /ORGANISM="Goniomonas sp, Strain m" /LENGTH=517 /DNA_ID=CAMNT_0001753781 /DNA_START=18 /DNA_END=1568 /DNA_ORIENTATION=-